jgi:transcriptional regulator GlxA family with amidase domain
MLQNIVAMAQPGVAPFELGVVCEVFGIDRSDVGLPDFDFAVISEGARPIRTSIGFEISGMQGLERAAEADLICVPASGGQPASQAVIDVLRAAVARGSRVLSVCTGAFTLGEAGLLDGRPCTTHWFHVDELERRFPQAEVTCDVLYVDAGPVITSAGTAAGIDACLHIVRKELGASVANGIARRMVVPPHREGGQAQYIANPVPECDTDTFAPLLDWLTEHLDEEYTVEQLAHRAHMSARTFARRFRAETGTTPHAWIKAQRLNRAEHLLETTDEPIERVAVMSGFGSGSLLRHHFVKQRGATPQAYRRAFRQSA